MEVVVAEALGAGHIHLGKAGDEVEMAGDQVEGLAVMLECGRAVHDQVDAGVGVVDVAVVPFGANAAIFDIQDIDFQSIQQFFEAFHAVKIP